MLLNYTLMKYFRTLMTLIWFIPIDASGDNRLGDDHSYGKKSDYDGEDDAKYEQEIVMTRDEQMFINDSRLEEPSPATSS